MGANYSQVGESSGDAEGRVEAHNAYVPMTLLPALAQTAAAELLAGIPCWSREQIAVY